MSLEVGLALVVQSLTTCTKISETLSSLPSQKLCLIIDVRAIPDDFRANLKILESRLNQSKEQLSIHGKDVDNSVVENLKKAESTLQELESEVRKLKEDIDCRKWFLSRWWLYFNLYLTSFPDKVDKKVESVKKDIEEVPGLIKKYLESSALMQQSASRQPIPTIVYDNGLYVPIQQSQNSVLEAIEKFGSRIVLLYGGVGKGKSTLAKYVCMLYGKDGERKDVFEYVLFLACGGSSKIDPSNKQYEILKRLSPGSLDISSEAGKTIDDKDRIMDFDVRTAKSLQNFFQSGKRILIILDDVSDVQFISKMWIAAEGGTQVKYLVTSQYPKLCDSFPKHSVRILMEDPSEQEAKDILASLVGLEDRIFPPHLQGIAGQLIGATGRNPLALACLASNVANNKTNLRAWKEAYKRLRQILDEEDTQIVLPDSPQSTPSRSLWAAMKICVDSLKSGNAKDILFLMYACKGESVPEEVLRIWHAVAKPSSDTTFSNLIAELRSRELLKSDASTIASELNYDGEDPADQDSMSWSLLTTVKLYIDQYIAGKEEMRSAFCALLGDDESKAECSVKKERGSETEETENGAAEVAVALCALYFDPDHTNEIVVEAATRACNASQIDWNPTIKDRRRKAIEPLIWLLDQAEENGLTLEVHSVRQVIIRYVRDSKLDAINISILLELTSSPAAKLATLSALADICIIEQIPLLQNDRLTFLKPLLHIFTANKDVQSHTPDGKIYMKIQEAASKALQNISGKASEENSVESILTSTPDLLPALVCSIQDSLLSVAPVSNVRGGYAASALWNLSVSEGESSKLQISREHGAIRSLVKALRKDDNPILQANSAGALSNLAMVDAIKTEILSEDGAVETLVKALSQDENPELQSNAAWTLSNLAAGEQSMQRADCALRILGEGAPQSLVAALSKDQNPKLQQRAAAALWSLSAGGGESGKLQISREHGAIRSLVKALRKDDNPILQAESAGALSNLAMVDAIKTEILSEDGAVETLVKALSQDENPELQSNAAWTLSNLAAGEQSMQRADCALRILGEGAPQSLVAALSKDQNPKLQQRAAAALWSLSAGGGESGKLQISREHGAIRSLVKALRKDDNPILQAESAGALSNLAMVDAIKTEILSEDGAVETLVKALSQDENPELQSNAAWTLSNLAAGEQSMQRADCALRILGEGAPQSLVAALSKDQNPKLQQRAAAALWSLSAGGGESGKLQISREHGAIRSLVKALRKDDNPILQANSAGALSNLAMVHAIKTEILSEDGAVETLVKALSQDENPELQRNAAGTLSNLAAGEQSMQRADCALRILGEGAPQSLVAALSKDQNPQLQQRAAAALWSLSAGGGESGKLQISREHGAIRSLVKALRKDDNPILQAESAGALSNLAMVDAIKTEILSEDGAVETLVKALSQDENPELQRNAAGTLSNLAAGEQSMQREDCALRILGEGAPQSLVAALSKDQNPQLQQQAASALWNLSVGGGESGKLQIWREHGAIRSLVKALRKDDNPILQAESAGALSNLAMVDAIKTEILSEDGAVETLVKALSQDENPELQRNAAGTLSNLAAGEESMQRADCALRILGEGAPQSLVAALSKDQNPQLQQRAAAALWSLSAGGGESGKLQISREHGAIRSLVKALRKDDNPILQANSAGALSNLAMVDAIKTEILSEDGAVETLVKALSQDENPELQRNAAGTLSNLAAGEQSMQREDCALRILGEGAPQSLVAALSKDQNPQLQQQAASALWNLSVGGGESSKLQISREHGAIRSLVKALRKDDNPILQANSAGALSNLAMVDAIKTEILSEDGAVETLVKALSQDENPELQRNAAGTLSNLAAGEQSMQREDCALRILGEGAPQSLVAALSKDQNPQLQQQAASALWNLSVGGGESGKLQIWREHGAIRNLVKALRKDDNPILQANSAGALSNLAMVDAIKTEILSEDGAVETLVKALSQDENPELQRNAAGTLSNLAAGEESMQRADCALRILGEGAPQSLVAALSKDQNPQLQQQAAGALWNLSVGGGESGKLQIWREHGAIRNLVKALRKDDNPILQANSAGALSNLAMVDAIKTEILSEDGAVETLVKALSQDENPELQSNAAGTLSNLAAGEESMQRADCALRILGEGAPQSLVAALSKDQNPQLQQQAAGALWNLSVGGGESGKLQISREHGAIRNLVKALGRDEDPTLQEFTAGALSCLAEVDSIKQQILSEDAAVETLWKALSKDNSVEFQKNAAWA